MRIKCRTLTVILFLLLTSEVCFGQSSFMSLTPGESTRGDVSRVLGQPVRSVSQTRAEHAPPRGLGKVFVEYHEGAQVVDKIEIDLLKPVTRAALVQRFKLPEEADARETGEDGKLVEYFGGDALTALVYTGGDEASGVSRVVHYSRALFESAAAKASGGPQAEDGVSATQDNRREIGSILGAIINSIAGSDKGAVTGATSTVADEMKAACGVIVSAAIYDKWIKTGGEKGTLGCPITAEDDAGLSPQGTTGRWIQFRGGDGGYLIQYKSGRYAGKVFEVSGCMFKLYGSMGGTRSWLGFPVGDGYESDPGVRQDFEGGYTVWDRKTYVCEAKKN